MAVILKAPLRKPFLQIYRRQSGIKIQNSNQCVHMYKNLTTRRGRVRRGARGGSYQIMVLQRERKRTPSFSPPPSTPLPSPSPPPSPSKSPAFLRSFLSQLPRVSPLLPKLFSILTSGKLWLKMRRMNIISLVLHFFGSSLRLTRRMDLI